VATWDADWPVEAEDTLTPDLVNNLREMLNYHTGITAITDAFEAGDRTWNVIYALRQAIVLKCYLCGNPATGALWQKYPNFHLDDDWTPDGAAAVDNLFKAIVDPARRTWQNEYDGTEAPGASISPEQCSFGQSNPETFHFNDLYEAIEGMRWQAAVPDTTAAYNGKATSFFWSGDESSKLDALTAAKDGHDALVEADADTNVSMGGGLFSAYWHQSASDEGGGLYRSGWAEQRTMGRIWIPADTVEVKLVAFEWTNYWRDHNGGGTPIIGAVPEIVPFELLMDTTESLRWDAADYALAGSVNTPDIHMGPDKVKLVLSGASLTAGTWTAGAWNYFQLRPVAPLMEDLVDMFDPDSYPGNTAVVEIDMHFRLLCKLTDV